MGWVQNLDNCDCVESPIFNVPYSDNEGDTGVSGVCYTLPSPPMGMDPMGMDPPMDPDPPIGIMDPDPSGMDGPVIMMGNMMEGIMDFWQMVGEPMMSTGMMSQMGTPPGPISPGTPIGPGTPGGGGGGGPTTGGGGVTPPRVGPTTPGGGGGGGGGPTTGGGGVTAPGVGPSTPGGSGGGGGGPTTGEGGVTTPELGEGQGHFHFQERTHLRGMGGKESYPRMRAVDRRWDTTFSDTLGTNLPPNVQIPLDPSVQNIPTYNREDLIYDPDYNISINTAQEVLNLATNRGSSPAGDPNKLLTHTFDQTLADILEVGKDVNYTQAYNGLTIGSILYNRELIKNSMTPQVKNLLANINIFNITSTRMEDLLLGGLTRAAINGNFKYYSPELLLSILQSGSSYYSRGVPSTANRSLRNTQIFNIARRSKSSLYARTYANGDTQREIQRYRIVPKDIDLTIGVKTRSGKMTGVRFSNNDGVPVTREDGTVSYPKMKNEFLTIRSNEKGEESVPLLSNRGFAYALGFSNESMIHGLLETQNEGWGAELIASSMTYGGGVSSVEVSGEGSAIPTAMLFSSVRESIRDTPSDSRMLRGTLVDYNLAWTSDYGDSTNFNATVSAYSGPRMSIYIDAQDPIWNIILEGGTLQLKTADFVEPVDGDVFVRKILTDFCLFPTDVVTYNTFQGTSELTQFQEGLPVIRTFRIVVNPLQEIKAEAGYVKSKATPDGKSPSGKPDVFSFQYEQDFRKAARQRNYSLDNVSFTTAKSSLGTLLDRIATIDANYNLKDGYKGKRLPQSDLLFNFTANEYAKIIQDVPSAILENVFEGAYNQITLFAVRLSDAEKTYLTSSRLIGTEITNKVQKKAINDSRYYPNKYEGRLYPRE